MTRAVASRSGAEDAPRRAETASAPSPATRITAGILVGAVALPAGAYTATTTLGTLGATENQRRTGDAVQTVCGQFASGAIQPANALQQELFDGCRSMVHTANDIVGTGASADSLGLGQSDLNNVVMTVATEELAATKSMATELASGQTNAAISRLRAVRSGNQIGLATVGFDTSGEFAGLSPAQNAGTTLRGGAAGDAPAGQWGYFVNVSGGIGDRDRSDNENEFDFEYYGLDIGADYRVNPHFVAGAVLSYGNDDVDFDSISTAAGVPSIPGGGIDSDGWGLSLYGTYFKDNFYIDGLIGYSRADYVIERIVLLPSALNPALTLLREADADTESDSYTLSIGGGLDYQRGDMSYGPYGRVTYQSTDIDGYSESGAGGLNLDVSSQKWSSLTSVVGMRANMTKSMSWGVVVPQARVGWVHEFKNESEEFSAIYANDPGRNQLISVTDDPDRNYFELGFSVSAVMSNGVQAFFDYQTLLGLDKLSDHAFTLGIRSEF